MIEKDRGTVRLSSTLKILGLDSTRVAQARENNAKNKNTKPASKNIVQEIITIIPVMKKLIALAKLFSKNGSLFMFLLQIGAIPSAKIITKKAVIAIFSLKNKKIIQAEIAVKLAEERFLPLASSALKIGPNKLLKLLLKLLSVILR